MQPRRIYLSKSWQKWVTQPKQWRAPKSHEISGKTSCRRLLHCVCALYRSRTLWQLGLHPSIRLGRLTTWHLRANGCTSPFCFFPERECRGLIQKANLPAMSVGLLFLSMHFVNKCNNSWWGTVNAATDARMLKIPNRSRREIRREFHLRHGFLANAGG